MIAPLPVSVFIIAKNEADRIGYTLRSVQGWVDEVVVIDSGSTDGTQALVEKSGVTLLHREWEGYGPQKIFGEAQCRNPWVLNLDADEEVTPELRAAIEGLFEDASVSPPCSAYKICRKMLFPYEDQPPPFAPGDKPVRLYHREKAGFKDSTVHDSVVVREGNVGQLPGVLLHRCFRSYAHWVDKIQFYSTMQAKDFVEKGRKPSKVRMVFEPWLNFWKAYLLRRYFLYGVDGFVGSFLYAYARLLRLAKAHELLKAQKYNETIAEHIPHHQKDIAA